MHAMHAISHMWLTPPDLVKKIIADWRIVVKESSIDSYSKS
jgi:hypothetical protein